MKGAIKLARRLAMYGRVGIWEHAPERIAEMTADCSPDDPLTTFSVLNGYGCILPTHSAVGEDGDMICFVHGQNVDSIHVDSRKVWSFLSENTKRGRPKNDIDESAMADVVTDHATFEERYLAYGELTGDWPTREKFRKDLATYQRRKRRERG